LSNWELNLNKKQIEYAACGAYSALEIYNRIREIGSRNNLTPDMNALLDGGSKSASGVKGPTRQQTKAYTLWHVQKKSLDEICKLLRTPENPLKRGTVIGHVVNALKADVTLEYDMGSLEELLRLGNQSYRFHGNWFNRRKAETTNWEIDSTSSSGSEI